MKLNIKTFLLTTIIAATLNGCGFHLREQAKLPPQLKSINVVMENKSRLANKSINQSLKIAGAKLDPSSNTTLYISNISNKADPIAYGSDGRVHRERLTLSLDFKVASNNDDLIKSTTIKTTRNHTVNPDDILSSNEEKEVLLDEMQQKLISQIVSLMAKQ